MYDPTRPSLNIEKGRRQYAIVTSNWEGPPQTPEPIAQAEPVAAGAPPQPEMLRRSDSATLNYTGTITDIDYASRELTLQNQEGKLETFVVDKEVQRFNEAKVGDKVSM